MVKTGLPISRVRLAGVHLVRWRGTEGFLWTSLYSCLSQSSQERQTKLANCLLRTPLVVSNVGTPTVPMGASPGRTHWEASLWVISRSICTYSNLLVHLVIYLFDCFFFTPYWRLFHLSRRSQHYCGRKLGRAHRNPQRSSLQAYLPSNEPPVVLLIVIALNLIDMKTWWVLQKHYMTEISITPQGISYICKYCGYLKYIRLFQGKVNCLFIYTMPAKLVSL